MTQAEKILLNKAPSIMAGDFIFSALTREKLITINEAIEAMKEIAELSFRAGYNYSISLRDEWAKDYPTMTEHINNLFNKQV